MPPKLKAQKNQSKPPTKPICPDHHLNMKFVADNLRWECRMDECARVAYPKIEDTGHPILGKGNVTLICQEDEDGSIHHFLRADNNVMIKVDSLLLNDTYTSGGRRMLSMVFDREVNIDVRGKLIT